MKQRSFQSGSAGFWASILSVVFGLLAIGGIQWGQNPDELANGLVSAVASPAGFVGLVGLIITGVATPIYKFVLSKKRFDFMALIGSPNTYILLGGAIIGYLTMTGISIDPNTPDLIADAVVSRNWVALAIVIFSNVLNPVIRYIRDRRSVPQINSAAAPVNASNAKEIGYLKDRQGNKSGE